MESYFGAFPWQRRSVFAQTLMSCVWIRLKRRRWADRPVEGMLPNSQWTQLKQAWKSVRHWRRRLSQMPSIRILILLLFLCSFVGGGGTYKFHNFFGLIYILLNSWGRNWHSKFVTWPTRKSAVYKSVIYCFLVEHFRSNSVHQDPYVLWTVGCLIWNWQRSLEVSYLVSSSWP
jgi:hypothetical protein